MNLRHLIYTSIAILLCCACGREDDSHPAITVSNGAQQWLVEQIAGDDFTVAPLLPPGSNPETYDPDVASLVGLQKSKVYLGSGTLGFEQTLEERIHDNFPDVKTYNISKGIDFISDTHEISDASEHKHHHGEDFDPHLAGSVRNMKVMATNVADILSGMRSDHKEVYAERLGALNLRLDSLDNALALLTAPEGSSFVVMHPMLSYFARDYKLKQVPLEVGGKEASPRQFKERLQVAGASAPRLLVLEAGFPEARAQEISKYFDIPYTNLMLDDYGWFENMKALGKAFQQNTAK